MLVGTATGGDDVNERHLTVQKVPDRVHDVGYFVTTSEPIALSPLIIDADDVSVRREEEGLLASINL